MTPHGPNVNRLIIERVSQLATQGGQGIAGGIRFIADDARRTELLREAERWVTGAISVLRTAPDCPGGTDEDLAALILRKLAARQLEQRKRR